MCRLQIRYEGADTMPEMTEAEQERARIVADPVSVAWELFTDYAYRAGIPHPATRAYVRALKYTNAIERNEHGGGE